MSEIDKLAIDEEELVCAVNAANIYPALNTDRIRETINIILENPDIQEGHYTNVIRGNYDGLDLMAHGFIHLVQDLRLLVHFFLEAENIVSHTTSQRSEQVLFLGKGPGRTSIAAIEIARKLKLRRIVFNDLIPEHIEQLREIVAKCYNTRDQKIGRLEICFDEGDFLQIADRIHGNFEAEFDGIFAMWSVLSEGAEFQSVEALKEKRTQLYAFLHNLLGKQGVLIEDVPYSEGVGSFYYLLRLKTYHVLHEMGVLEGENDSIIVTNYSDTQSTGYPFHMRYAPPNGKHYSELAHAGFGEYHNIVTTLPSGFQGAGRDQYEEMFGTPDKIRDLFMGNNLVDVENYLLEQERVLLTPNDKHHPMAKRKKTTLWRKFESSFV